MIEIHNWMKHHNKRLHIDLIGNLKAQMQYEAYTINVIS